MTPWRFTPKSEVDPNTGLMIPPEFSRIKVAEEDLRGAIDSVCMADRGAHLIIKVTTTEVVRDFTKGGARQLKNPITKDTVTEQVLTGREAWIASRNQVLDVIQELHGLVESPYERMALAYRQRLIRVLWDDDSLAMICELKWQHRKHMVYRIVRHYEPLGFQGISRAGGSIDNEIRELVSGSIVEEFQDALEDFRFIVRSGFIDEIHCPRAWWELQRLFITGFGIEKLFAFKKADGQGYENVVFTWAELAKHPVRKVVFTDAPEVVEVKTLTWEDVAHLCPVESMVQEFLEREGSGGILVDNIRTLA
jgi:hypothetical protein